MVYEYSYRLGYEQSLENVLKQLRNPNFFKHLDRRWIMGYLDGVEDREDITEELKKEVQQLRQKFGLNDRKTTH
ncbi:hypothetical protein DRO69_02490 [Candidatus Bathyarchaeota archaeon]|nr:MAG: hypothetical protein DRO69_02490 [Candidatus Bathyarchaeota archaeon]